MKRKLIMIGMLLAGCYGIVEAHPLRLLKGKYEAQYKENTDEYSLKQVSGTIAKTITVRIDDLMVTADDLCDPPLKCHTVIGRAIGGKLSFGGEIKIKKRITCPKSIPKLLLTETRKISGKAEMGSLYPVLAALTINYRSESTDFYNRMVSFLLSYPDESVSTVTDYDPCKGIVVDTYNEGFDVTWDHPITARFFTMDSSPRHAVRISAPGHYYNVDNRVENGYGDYIKTDIITILDLRPRLVKNNSPAVTPEEDPLVPLVPTEDKVQLDLKSDMPDPYGVDGTVSFDNEGVSYGKANFWIRPKETQGKASISLKDNAKQILRNSGVLDCDAVITARDQLGNVKITTTPITVIAE